MDFSLTEDQQALQDAVIDFARSELGYDMIEADRAEAFSREAWQKCAEFGIQGLPIPEEYGGLEFSAAAGLLAQPPLPQSDGPGYACRSISPGQDGPGASRAYGRSGRSGPPARAENSSSVPWSPRALTHRRRRYGTLRLRISLRTSAGGSQGR